MNTKFSFLLVTFVLTCFGLSPVAKGTPDPASVGGTNNTADGRAALAVTTGGNNSGFGFWALFRNTSGTQNTAVGSLALQYNSTGGNNTATGYSAMTNNGKGFSNTADGAFALYSNTGGTGNTAIGGGALYYNITSNNTAVGSNALYNNSTGTKNTATGEAALVNNSSGSYNTATGAGALKSNGNGVNNTAMGLNALAANGAGSYNTAMGVDALLNNNGSSNVGLGVNAGNALTTGSGNVCIGVNVPGVAGESNTTRIKNIYSSVATGRAVYVDSDNKIGTLSSSRRYKEQIQPMEKASETLFALKPVTFRYRKEIDRSRALSFGLIAEDVAEISPDLVTRDRDGKPETVRYEAVNAMLLNEFLKQHHMVQEQQKEINALKAELKEQRAFIRKVNDKVELGKPAPQTVAENR
jgi:trimeric autotransporter adhesin